MTDWDCLAWTSAEYFGFVKKENSRVVCSLHNVSALTRRSIWGTHRKVFQRLKIICQVSLLCILLCPCVFKFIFKKCVFAQQLWIKTNVMLCRMLWNFVELYLRARNNNYPWKPKILYGWIILIIISSNNVLFYNNVFFIDWDSVNVNEQWLQVITTLSDWESI